MLLKQLSELGERGLGPELVSSAISPCLVVIVVYRSQQEILYRFGETLILVVCMCVRVRQRECVETGKCFFENNSVQYLSVVYIQFARLSLLFSPSTSFLRDS